MRSWKQMYILLLLGHVFCIEQVKLVDSVIQVLYILSDLQSDCSINYWERNAEISNYNCGFIYPQGFSLVVLAVCFI